MCVCHPRICNWECTWPIDHDDGSQEYTDTHNFLWYGGAKNFLGRNKASLHNIYVDPDGKPSEGAWAAADRSGPTSGASCANNDGSIALGRGGHGGSGYNETWSHNRCIMRSSNHTVYAFGQTGDGPQVHTDPDTCDSKIFDNTDANSFFAPGGRVLVQCTRDANASETWTLQEWQALAPANDGEGPLVKRDRGSTVAERPSTNQIMAWGAELLRGGPT